MVSLLAIFLLNQYTVLQASLVLLLVFYTRWTLNKNTAIELQYQPEGGWLLRYAYDEADEHHVANLQIGSVLTPFFAVLRFTSDSYKKRHILIFKDSIDAEKFRQLRVRLKVQGIRQPVGVSGL